MLRQCLIVMLVGSYTSAVAANIEELCEAIDLNGDGQICFEEFKLFYDTVLQQTAAPSGADT